MLKYIRLIYSRMLFCWFHAKYPFQFDLEIRSLFHELKQSELRYLITHVLNYICVCYRIVFSLLRRKLPRSKIWPRNEVRSTNANNSNWPIDGKCSKLCYRFLQHFILLTIVKQLLQTFDHEHDDGNWWEEKHELCNSITILSTVDLI